MLAQMLVLEQLKRCGGNKIKKKCYHYEFKTLINIKITTRSILITIIIIVLF